MEICECHIVISQIIHCFAYKFISKKCWITFYIGMNVFFFQKIRNNVFDFLRRTSMHGGKRNRVTDFWRNCLNVFSGQMFKKIHMFQKPLPAFFKYRRITGIFHSLDKIIDFVVLNSLQIIAARHIKLESIRTSKSKFLCDHMQDHPAFYILFHRLWNVKFCRPFAVICLILCYDAWFRNTCGKFRSIHFLYGL